MGGRASLEAMSQIVAAVWPNIPPGRRQGQEALQELLGWGLDTATWRGYLLASAAHFLRMRHMNSEPVNGLLVAAELCRLYTQAQMEEAALGRPGGPAENEMIGALTPQYSAVMQALMEAGARARYAALFAMAFQVAHALSHMVVTIDEHGITEVKPRQ